MEIVVIIKEEKKKKKPPHKRKERERERERLRETECSGRDTKARKRSLKHFRLRAIRFIPSVS